MWNFLAQMLQLVFSSMFSLLICWCKYTLTFICGMKLLAVNSCFVSVLNIKCFKGIKRNILQTSLLTLNFASFTEAISQHHWHLFIFNALWIIMFFVNFLQLSLSVAIFCSSWITFSFPSLIFRSVLPAFFLCSIRVSANAFHTGVSGFTLRKWPSNVILLRLILMF